LFIDLCEREFFCGSTLWFFGGWVNDQRGVFVVTFARFVDENINNVWKYQQRLKIYIVQADVSLCNIVHADVSPTLDKLIKLDNCEIVFFEIESCLFFMIFIFYGFVFILLKQISVK
jgi:hypothetical protein